MLKSQRPANGLAAAERTGNKRASAIIVLIADTVYRKLMRGQRERVQRIPRADHHILRAIQLIRDGTVGQRRVQPGVPQRSAGGAIQRHEVCIGIAGEQQLTRGAQQAGPRAPPPLPGHLWLQRILPVL